jgi:hypothetical protein
VGEPHRLGPDRLGEIAYPGKRSGPSPALAAVAASTIPRIERFRTRAFVRARCSESRPPAAGAGAQSEREPHPLIVFIAPSAGSVAAPCSLGCGGTTTRSVPPCLARDAHRHTHLRRDPLRGVGAVGGGTHSAAAPAALHGLGLKPSPCLGVASGLLLRPTIRGHLARGARHLTTSRGPRDEALATSRPPTVARTARPGSAGRCQRQADDSASCGRTVLSPRAGCRL